MQFKIIQNFLFVLAFLSCLGINAQIDVRSFNIFNDSDFFLEGTLKEKGLYEFKLFKSTDGGTTQEHTQTFSLNPLTKDAFIQNFFTKYKSLKDGSGTSGQHLPQVNNLRYEANRPDTIKEADYRLLEQEASKLFFMFISRSIVIEDLNNQPIAGEICYADTIKVLRRDYNDKSLDKRIAQSWKFYKQDKKWAKQLMKNGIFESEAIELKQDTNINLNKVPGQQYLDSLSRFFEIEEVFEFLDKRKFKSEKTAEFLRARANSRKEAYQDMLDAIASTNRKLANAKDKIGESETSKKQLDELVKLDATRKLIPTRMDTIKIEIEKKRKVLKEQLNTLESIRIDKGQNLLKSSVDAIGFYIECLESLTYEYAPVRECTAASRLMDSAVNKVKNSLNNLIATERELLANLEREPVRADTTDAATESEVRSNDREKDQTKKRDLIRVLADRLIPLCNEILATKQAIDGLHEQYRQQLEELMQLDDQLLQTNLQIPLDNIREQIQDALNYRIRNPGKVGNFDARNLEHEILKTLKTNIKTNTRARDSLGSLQKKQLLQLARLEDLLIFKQFVIDSIVLEINEGFIENILMVGKVKEYSDKYGEIKVDLNDSLITSTRTLKFENSSPIGFSRKLDFDAIKGKKLYTRGGGKMHYETYLEDILDVYIQIHKVGRRDFSPANQVVSLKRNDDTPFLCKTLYKQATYRLFEAKVFSDFVGLDATEPNGLIQTEVNKRINLLTSRTSFQFFRLGGLQNQWNIGLFAFLDPSLKLSKIEDNNRYLQLGNKDRFINNEYAPVQFTSTLSLKQFENFSAGATANLLLLDMPNLKSTLYLNWGFLYGRTAVQDSVRTATNGMVTVNPEAVNQFGVNTFSHFPEAVWSIYEDERYGFSVSWQHHWFYLRDNRFEQVGNPGSFAEELSNPAKNARQFNTIRFVTYLEPATNNKGRLFFRYTYNWQQGFWRTGFHQAQVGYSFFLLGRQAE